MTFDISKDVDMTHVRFLSIDDLFLILCDHGLSEIFKVDLINMSRYQIACVEITSESFDSLDSLVLQPIYNIGYIETVYGRSF